MKIYLASIALLVASAHGFAPVPIGVRSRAPTALCMSDSETAIKDAMAASKKHGATSPEARAAWDIVEEIDAATR